MRYVRDRSRGAFAVKVQCLKCLQMVTLADTVIDREGPPFRAYYHLKCAPKGAVKEANEAAARGEE